MWLVENLDQITLGKIASEYQELGEAQERYELEQEPEACVGHVEEQDDDS